MVRKRNCLKIFSKPHYFLHFESWESLTSHVSGTFWRFLPTSYLRWLPVSIFASGPQGFSPFLSPNNRSESLFPQTPTCPLSLPGPSYSLVIAFFSFLMVLNHPHLGASPCLSSWVLWTVSWVFCISFISFDLWLISTY